MLLDRHSDGAAEAHDVSIALFGEEYLTGSISVSGNAAAAPLSSYI